jgi:predicted Fe-Mo cluster-binding NifX family protein
MKIAAITDDGQTISQHFGRAAFYQVVIIEDGRIIKREMRQKLGHAQLHNEEHQHHQGRGEQHGFGSGAEKRHAKMVEAIKDCEALLCRGMGRGAYEYLKTRGIRPVVTDFTQIDEAMIAYASGQIVDHIEKLH